MHIKAAFLDIDGVVVLSEELHQEKIIMVASDPLATGEGHDTQRGVKIDLERDWNTELAGIGDHRIYQWIKQKNPAFPLSEQEFLSACETYYLANAPRLQTRDSFHEAFNLLASRGMFIAAVSSGVRKQVDCNLQAAGINDRLVFSHSADDVEAGMTKPHPRPYLKALDALNAMIRQLDPDHVDILPHECLVVEDSGSGAQSGISAGMQVVHWTLNQGRFNADAQFKLDVNDRLDTFLHHLLADAPPQKPDLFGHNMA